MDTAKLIKSVHVFTQDDVRRSGSRTEWVSKEDFDRVVEELTKWNKVEDVLPKPGYELVNVRCRNKNKEDGIWLEDVCYIDEDTNTWGKRYHTWETILEWRYIY